MAVIVNDPWTRPKVRVNAARRSIRQAIEMLCDDTIPSDVAKNSIAVLDRVARILEELEVGL